MNNYEAKKQARIERFEQLADKARSESNRKYNNADSIAGMIPFGQPILVGHHSEKRARRDQQRIHDNMRASIEAQKKAEHYERKAKVAASNSAISSDDPAAIILLKEKLATLEKGLEHCKEINKTFRKGGIEALAEMIPEEYLAIEKDMKFRRGFGQGKQPYEGYALTSLRSKIKAAQQRIDQLEKQRSEVTTEITVGDITIIDNVEDNRIQVIFPGKPSQEVRDTLKSYGFRWAPSNDAWQRNRSSNVLAIVKNFISQLSAL